MVRRLADEKQEPPAVLRVLYVPAAGGSVLGGGVLGLPVEQLSADGVVAIARGRREASCRLEGPRIRVFEKTHDLFAFTLQALRETITSTPTLVI
jgi:hypothetical protein